MAQLLRQRYLVIGRLGRGGMGIVYKAMDTQLDNRPVAVKELIQRTQDPQEIAVASKAFKKEVNILAHLHHPNLPSIHEYFEESGRWYFVMEFIEGETLEDYLQAQGGRISPPRTALEQVYQAFCAKTREAGGLLISCGIPKQMSRPQICWRYCNSCMNHSTRYRFGTEKGKTERNREWMPARMTMTFFRPSFRRSKQP